jgi:N-acetylglucosaminyldiphosphoundecaprenol N-acetyl-beta-D-mannosaminyltransferase
VTVLGCQIDRLTLDQSAERCRRAIESGEYLLQISINAAKVVAMRDDAALREIAARSGLVTADGISIVWAARALGSPLPGRVTGIDLMDRLLALAEEGGHGIYLLGARPEVLEQAVRRLRERRPRLRIAGHRDGYFGAREVESVKAEIRGSGAAIVFVAMGSPRTERWLGAHGHKLGARVAMGVGGSLDVIAGRARRAPAPVQRLGLEWLYRLLQEPRRLARRNLLSVTFVGLLARELVRGRRAS